MTNLDDQQKAKPTKKNFFEFLTEGLAWLQIVASPLALAAILGFTIYISKPSTTRLVIAIAITLIGLIGGMILATRVWRKRGTADLMSKVSATPELDDATPELEDFGKEQ